ncbi:MAG: alpha/beta hydrolase [Jatrophihabitans sp.]
MQMDYLPRRAMDVHGSGGPRVLFWHGRGPNSRHRVARLAAAVAERGVTVYVPDWNSKAPDHGRSELLASVDFVRRETGDDLALAGWSMGARSAVVVALAPELVDGWRPRSVVGLATSLMQSDPFDLRPADLVGAASGPPFTFVHGTLDTIVDEAQVRALVSGLRAHGHGVTWRETPADHVGIVMASYDETAETTAPDNALLLSAGEVCVAAVAAAALGARLPDA